MSIGAGFASGDLLQSDAGQLMRHYALHKLNDVGASFNRQSATIMNVGNNGSVGADRIWTRVVGEIGAQAFRSRKPRTLADEIHSQFGSQLMSNLIRNCHPTVSHHYR